MTPAGESEHTSRFRGLLAGASIRKLLPYLALGILLVAAVIALGREIEGHVSDIESWITGLGPSAPLVYVGLFVLGTSLFVPDTLLCIVAGALFGFVEGAAVIAAGNLLSTTLQFNLSRRLLRARVERAIETRPSLAAIQRAVYHDQLRLQVLLRLTPLNPATISYLLGATGVRYWSFLVASFALLPVLFIEVYFGYAGKHMVGIASSDRHAEVLHDGILLGGIVACLVVMTFISRLARRAVMQAVAESDPEKPDGDAR